MGEDRAPGLREYEQEIGLGPPERVGFGPRVEAVVIDAICCGIIGGVVGLVGGSLGGAAGGAAGAASGGQEGAVFGAFFGAMAGFALGFYIAFSIACSLYGLWEGFTGAAAGKRLLGLRIANADGTRASVGRLLLRYTAKNIGFVLAVLAGITGLGGLERLGSLAQFVIFIGCFFVLGSAHQALHDRAAKTAVYRSDEIR